jgi:hypothetical protein
MNIFIIKNIRPILLLILSILFYFGCSEDNPPTKTSDDGTSIGENEKWEVDETFSGSDKILLNAKVTDSKYIVAGVSILVMYDSTLAQTSYVTTSPVNNSAINYTPAISGPYVMYAGSGDIQFILNSIVYPGGNSNTYGYPFTYGFRLSDFDLGYKDGATVLANDEDISIGAFNNQDQFLTVISDSFDLDISFCLINLNATLENCASETCLEINPVIERIQQETNISVRLTQISSYEDIFLVSMNAELYVIESDGTVNIAQGIETPVSQFFTANDTIFAVKHFPVELYSSVDRGYTWNLFATGFPEYKIKFFQVSNQLCFYVFSQIVTIDLQNGSIQELDNTGLEGSEITSVNEYDGKVWITTLSGMFKKNIEDFFTLKESNLSKLLPTSINIVTR